MLKRLIVNADDLGRTPGINRGVERAHASGIVSSATVMVAYPPAGELSGLAGRRPRLGLGLHLALTGGRPVLPPERIPSLIGGGGQLHRRPDAALAAAAFDEVLAEARAQLARFRERVGREPTHVDAHHHCHRVGVVLEAVVELAREAGLPVRATSEEQRLRFRSEGLKTCDAFIDGFYDADANLETLLRLLGSLGEGTTELMCHPAEVDDELRESSGYAEPRAAELAALTSPEARAALEGAGVELIHFGRL